ncbi:ECF transporter S component [Patescibacteria group bacterium]
MEKIKGLATPRINTKKLILFSALLGIATVAPMLLSHQQIVSGPIVNATLIISVILLGTESAILVGLVPSIIALSVGLLPAVLAPMIPFIMLSNAILVLLFGYLYKKNYWFALVFGSLVKFLFLYVTSSVVISLLIKTELASQVALIMSWPQFLTAVAGGFLAFGFLKITKKVYNKNK